MLCHKAIVSMFTPERYIAIHLVALGEAAIYFIYILYLNAYYSGGTKVFVPPPGRAKPH
jgi:hypothetical protein